MWIPEITLLEVLQNKGLENKPKLALILMPISDEKCTEKPQEKGQISNYFQLKWPLLRKGIYQIQFGNLPKYLPICIPSPAMENHLELIEKDDGS